MGTDDEPTPESFQSADSQVGAAHAGSAERMPTWRSQTQEAVDAIFASDSPPDVYMVESSFYIGGMLPKVPPGVPLLVLWEPVDLLVGTGQPPITIYDGGMESPVAGYLPRKRLELVALEISTHRNLDYSRLADELLRIRQDFSRRVVYNQPEAWLRDAANDADILFQFLLARSKFRLFGVFLYSDFDAQFDEFIRASHGAIHEMSGDRTLLFSFGKTGELERNFSFVRNAIIGSEWKRFEKEHPIVEVPTIDAKRAELEQFAAAIYDRNKSIAFARLLGVENQEMPCLALWCDIDSHEVITYSFDNSWIASGHIGEHFKGLFDIIDTVLNIQPNLPYESLLHELETRFRAQKFKKFIKRRTTNQSIANLLKVLGTGATAAGL